MLNDLNPFHSSRITFYCCTIHRWRLLALPEEHAHSGVGDLGLDGLPRPHDSEQFSLWERHDRQTSRQRTANDRRRWRADDTLSSTYTRKPPQQTGHCPERRQRTTTTLATCQRRHSSICSTANILGLHLGSVNLANTRLSISCFITLSVPSTVIVIYTLHSWIHVYFETSWYHYQVFRAL